MEDGRKEESALQGERDVECGWEAGSEKGGTRRGSERKARDRSTTPPPQETPAGQHRGAALNSSRWS